MSTTSSPVSGTRADTAAAGEVTVKAQTHVKSVVGTGAEGRGPTARGRTADVAEVAEAVRSAATSASRRCCC